jgi:hypothetical protein
MLQSFVASGPQPGTKRALILAFAYRRGLADTEHCRAGPDSRECVLGLLADA